MNSSTGNGSHPGSEHRGGTPTSNRSPVLPMAAGSRGVSIDFVKLAWESRWLLLLGVLLGSAVGYFQYVKSTPMFRSAAQIQIIDSIAKNMPVDALDSGLQARNLADEALVLHSEHLLRRAAELGELGNAPTFAGMSDEAIAATLAASESLTVGPARETGSTSVFVIQYESSSPITTQRVVQSIVDAYAAHLQDQYRNVGQETIDLIQSARTDVSGALKEAESLFAEFRDSSGLIYRGNEVMAVHRDNADKFLIQQQSLAMRRANLFASINAAKQAIADGTSKEAILIALQRGIDSSGKQFGSEDPRNSWEIQKLRSQPVVSLADQMRHQRLLPLEIERESLIDSFGNDHPALGTINKRIAIVLDTIAKVEESESTRQDELDVAMNSAESGRPTSIDPQERLKDEIRFAVEAQQQLLNSVDAELDVVGQAYAEELRLAKAESSAELRSAQLIREIDRQQALHTRIVERLDEVNLMSGGGGLKVFPFNTAKVGFQFAPSLPKSIILGVFVGGMLAAGLALLRALSDRSYTSASDISSHVALPVIGHVPVLDAAKVDAASADAKFDPLLCTHFDAKSRRSEAFRAIRTAVFFSNQGGDNQVILVTSASPSEGKSTIASNLAVSISQAGRTVLLLDADLRRPRIAKMFGFSCSKGTAWAIGQAGEKDVHLEIAVNEAIHETSVPNLSVMPAGTRPECPAELLSSKDFDKLIATLREKFDMIIVDSPPLLAVSDPSNIVARVDGVVLAVRLRKNIKPAIAQAARMLETLGANVLGVVVNGVGSRASRGYGKNTNQEGCANDGSFKFGYGYAYGGSSYSGDGDSYATYYEDDPVPVNGVAVDDQLATPNRDQ